MIFVGFVNMPRHFKTSQTLRTEKSQEMKKNDKEDGTEEDDLYRSRHHVKNLLLAFHAPIDKSKMIAKLRFAALPKMVRWWMKFMIREQVAKQSEGKILLEMGPRKLS